MYPGFWEELHRVRPRSGAPYVRPHGRRSLRVTVKLPAGLRRGPVGAYVDGRRVTAKRTGASLRFSLRARGRRAVDWAVARR